MDENNNNNDIWTDDIELGNNKDKEIINNWAIGTYVRIRPPTKKNKGIYIVIIINIILT